MSKLSVKLFTLCDHAIIGNDGKLSVVGIFDRIFLPKLPASYSRFFVVIILEGEENTSQELALSMESPTDIEVIPKRTFSVKLGPNGKANILTDIVNINLAEPGDHQFILRTKKGILAKTPLSVVMVKEQVIGEGN